MIIERYLFIQTIKVNYSTPVKFGEVNIFRHTVN